MGDVVTVKALVAAKADVDKKDEQGRTALSFVVKKIENLMLEKRPCYRVAKKKVPKTETFEFGG